MVSWESKGTHPKPTPPRNKALIRPYSHDVFMFDVFLFVFFCRMVFYHRRIISILCSGLAIFSLNWRSRKAFLRWISTKKSNGPTYPVIWKILGLFSSPISREIDHPDRSKSLPQYHSLATENWLMSFGSLK